MSLKCELCDGSLIILETLCTEPYSNGSDWFRDIKQKCVCKNCGKEQEITVDTVRQDKWFK